MVKEMYIDILHRLRDAVRRKRSEKWRINSWFLLHEDGPAHRSVLVKDFLRKNFLTTQEQTPYTPDLAPADFLTVPSTEISIKDCALVMLQPSRMRRRS